MASIAHHGVPDAIGRPVDIPGVEGKIAASRARRAKFNLRTGVTLDFSEEVATPAVPPPTAEEIRARQQLLKTATRANILSDVKVRHRQAQRSRNGLHTLDPAHNAERAKVSMHLELHRRISVHGAETMRAELARQNTAEAARLSAAGASLETGHDESSTEVALAALDAKRQHRQGAWAERMEELLEAWQDEWYGGESPPTTARAAGAPGGAAAASSTLGDLPAPHPPVAAKDEGGRRAPARAHSLFTQNSTAALASSSGAFGSSSTHGGASEAGGAASPAAATDDDDNAAAASPTAATAATAGSGANGAASPAGASGVAAATAAAASSGSAAAAASESSGPFTQWLERIIPERPPKPAAAGLPFGGGLGGGGAGLHVAATAVGGAPSPTHTSVGSPKPAPSPPHPTEPLSPARSRPSQARKGSLSPSLGAAAAGAAAGGAAGLVPSPARIRKEPEAKATLEVQRAVTSSGRPQLRYLDSDKQRGDIAAAYPTTVDPAQAEAARRMDRLGSVYKSALERGGAADRPPFNEKWAQMRAPDGGSLYALVPPMVEGRMCEAEVGEEAVLHAEHDPAALLPTGSDFDDEPLLRAAKLHATVCHSHFGRLLHGGGADGGEAAALYVPPVRDGGDAVGLAAMQADVEKLLCLAYSSFEAETATLLPMPLRGAKSAAAFLYEKSRGAHADGGRPKPLPRPQPAESDEAAVLVTPDGYTGLAGSGAGVLSHIGKSLASAANSAERLERGNVKKQIEAAKAAEKAAQRKAEEDAAAAKVAAAEREKQKAEQMAIQAAAEPMDAEAVKRMQAVLDVLEVPLDAAVEFALKYTAAGQKDALGVALPLWEEAAAAVADVKEPRNATEAQRERCLAAAAALERATSDVATIRGTPFKEAFKDD